MLVTCVRVERLVYVGLYVVYYKHKDFTKDFIT